MSSLAAAWPRRRAEIALVGLGLVAAALLGPALYYFGAEVFGWLALPFAGVLLLVRPVLGMLLVAGTLPIENLGMFGNVTATRLLGIAVFAVWLTRKFGRRESWQAVTSTPFLVMTALLVGFAFLSSIWATYPADVYGAAAQLARMVLWSLLIIDLVTSWDRAVWLARALVVGGILTSVFVVQQYSVILQQSTEMGETIGGNRAGQGIAGGLNYTAAVLTTILPLAFFLMRDREQKLWRGVAMLYIPLGVGAVALTQSRLSYAVLALVMVAEYWESIRLSGGLSWTVLALGLGALLAILLAPQNLILERFEVLRRDLYGERIYLYRLAAMIYWDHPILGAGYDNFPRLFAEYQYLVPGGSASWSGLRGPHSSYAGFLADLGPVGLGLWLGLLGIAWRYLRRAWSALTAAGSLRIASLVKAVTYSLLAQFAYGWGSVVHRDKLVWLLLGLSVAIGHLAAKPSLQASGEWANPEPGIQVSRSSSSREQARDISRLNRRNN